MKDEIKNSEIPDENIGNKNGTESSPEIEYYEDILAELKDEYGDDNRAYEEYLKNEFNQEEMERPSNPSWLKDDNFNESETIMEAPILLGKITPVYPTAAQRFCKVVIYN